MYKLKDAPGPGNYNIGLGDNGKICIDLNWVILSHLILYSSTNAGPKWGFGSGQRNNLRNTDDPGMISADYYCF